jgi:DNA polymerase-3 subunit delta'
LTRAVQRGQLHHAYRFEGPEGVGKELTAFSLAQIFACTNSGAAPKEAIPDVSGGQPAFACGKCSACLRVMRFVEGVPQVPQHPDVILVGRGLYPASMVGSKETTGIGVEQIRRIVLPRAAHGPHESRGLFVIIRNAEELSVAAANSLLKTLEEPRPSVYFILLTSAPGRLLDTIRSRTLALRFGPLSEACLRDLLQERSLNPELAGRAEGSISVALELSESGRLETESQFVQDFERALLAPSIDRVLEIAGTLPKDREAVANLMLAYARYTAEQARASVTEAPERAARFASRHARIIQGLAALERNATPLTVVEAMAAEIRAAEFGAQSLG